MPMRSDRCTPDRRGLPRDRDGHTDDQGMTNACSATCGIVLPLPRGGWARKKSQQARNPDESIVGTPIIDR